jgi:GcrA cell cycle regulator
MAWTDEQYEKAKKLAEEGLSASEIGIHLGKTRNAVLGKLHRNGIEKRVRKESRKDTKRGRRPKRQFVLFHQMGLIDKNSQVRRAHLVQDGYVPKPEEPAPEGQRKSLLELEEHHCRWPIGEVLASEFHFCGADRVDGLPYCDAHCKRAYVTPAFKVREITKVEVVETEDA